MQILFDQNYFVIHGWMINRLELKGNELTIFAIIYGFSQDGQSEYSGGLTLLKEWTNCSKPTLISILKSLLHKGYISKHEYLYNNVRYVKYVVHRDILLALKYQEWDWLEN